jgi:hypothetical protein
MNVKLHHLHTPARQRASAPETTPEIVSQSERAKRKASKTSARKGKEDEERKEGRMKRKESRKTKRIYGRTHATSQGANNKKLTVLPLLRRRLPCGM